MGGMLDGRRSHADSLAPCGPNGIKPGTADSSRPSCLSPGFRDPRACDSRVRTVDFPSPDRLRRLPYHGRCDALSPGRRRSLSRDHRARGDRPQQLRTADLRPDRHQQGHRRQPRIASPRAPAFRGGIGRHGLPRRPRPPLQARPLDLRLDPRQRVHRHGGLPVYHRQARLRLRIRSRHPRPGRPQGLLHLPDRQPRRPLEQPGARHLPARQQHAPGRRPRRTNERGRPRRPRRGRRHRPVPL